MTSDNNTTANQTGDNSNDDSTKLPKFSVNVVPTQDAKKNLAKMLVRFRGEDLEPLVFGDNNTPEGAVIPFSALVRLMKHDHADFVSRENAFQGEISQRVASSDAARARGEEPGLLLETDEDFFDFAESLGEVGKQWAQTERAKHRPDEGPNDDA